MDHLRHAGQVTSIYRSPWLRGTGESRRADQAGFVLREGAPADWYWLENPLFKEEQEELDAAGKLDSYISVEPEGQWGFLDAVNELFRRSAKSANDIQHVNGRPEVV